MDITITPTILAGTVHAIPSKSQAHRLLICAALAEGETRLSCPASSRDIEATVRCLEALGAQISRDAAGYTVRPIGQPPARAVLPCRDSGSTLRFLLPLAAALGVDATFLMEGRLPLRPLSPLWEELERMGCTLTRPTPDTLRCHGQLRAGVYTLSGGVSSQFVTGLLLALPLLPGASRLEITGRLESAPYVTMTLRAMEQFGVRVQDLAPAGNQRFRSPGTAEVEGDWSSAAFFLAAGALGSSIAVTGLRPDSPQGDRAAEWLLPALEERQIIDASDIPDLVPILAVTAACKNGAVFTNIRRLRLKESDRVESVRAMLSALGGRAEAEENTLTVHGTGLRGGRVDAQNDHRIAMSAAIAATACSGRVTVLGARCVEKSYPQFWEVYKELGGHYEQYLR